ncbi:MAG: cell division protein ZapE [Pseudomonadota bacterium]
MIELSHIYAQQATEGTIAPDPAQEAVLPEFERIQRDLLVPEPKRKLFSRRARREPVRGLYLWGGVGRGKSFLMDLFVAHVEVPKRRVHFHAFMQEVQAGMNKARKQGVDDAIAPVAEAVAEEVRLLAFDEMQITDIADAMIVGRLFEKLFEDGVTVVTTSNRPPDDLYENGLNRDLFVPFIEMIKERLTVWELASETDYRQNRLAGEQVYFYPANAAAKEAVGRLWLEMTGVDHSQTEASGSTEMQANRARGLQLGADHGLTLMVKGREVHLSRFRNGVARVSFWDLCGQPLGPADYLAVADAVRVLILEDVPQLDATKFNAARRFVTLIDALYEARIKLIVTAAVPPEQLYLEGTGSFEFERTASRLREMQSAEWGKD